MAGSAPSVPTGPPDDEPVDASAGATATHGDDAHDPTPATTPTSTPGSAPGSTPTATSASTAAPDLAPDAGHAVTPELVTLPDVRRPLSARLFPHPALRALVPLLVLAVIVGVAGVRAAIGTGRPTLPAITPAQLLAKLAGASQAAFSGTATMTTDLGLPNLPSTGIQGANPILLLAGAHTLQIESDGPDRQRVGFLAQLSEYVAVRDGDQLWLYDSTSGSVTHRLLRLGAHHAAGGVPPATASPAALAPTQMAQGLLALAGPRAQLTVTGTERIAGRDAYTLTVEPNQTGTLVQEMQLAIDASTGVPLRVALYPGATQTPALELRFTHISYHAPAASEFTFTPPPGASVTDVTNKPKKPGTGISMHRHGAHFTTVAEVDGVSVGKVERAFLSGNSSLDPSLADVLTDSVREFVVEVATSGVSVKGAFGTGLLYTTRLVTVLVTNDDRIFVGLVSPQVVEAAAAGSGG
jgi:outer membrane lipoprotein-sorting protein